jgi:hypothetical protein
MQAEKREFVERSIPTQSGEYTAWLPEYQGEVNDLSPDGWRTVPMRTDPRGAPSSPYMEGVTLQIGMCSFAQANAIAWQHAAIMESKTGRPCAVRVVAYKIKYDIKCYREKEQGNGN